MKKNKEIKCPLRRAEERQSFRDKAGIPIPGAIEVNAAWRIKVLGTIAAVR